MNDWINRVGYANSRQTYWQFVRNLFVDIIYHNVCKANRIQIGVYDIDSEQYKECFESLDLVTILNKQNAFSNTEAGFIWVLNTCVFVVADYTLLLVDVGISGKRVEQGLNSLELTGKDIDGILITHEHSDHIKGLGVIARKHQIPVYATEGTVEALSHMNLGKMPEGIFRESHADEPYELN